MVSPPASTSSALLQIAQGDREARRIVTLAKFGLYAFTSDDERVLVTRLLNGDRTPKFLLSLAGALGHAVIDRANLHREAGYTDLMARTLRRLSRVAERLACAERGVLERLGALVAEYEADVAVLEAARLKRMEAQAARRRAFAAPHAAREIARMIRKGALKIQPQSDAEPDDDSESSDEEGETLSLVDDDDGVPWALLA